MKSLYQIERDIDSLRLITTADSGEVNGIDEHALDAKLAMIQTDATATVSALLRLVAQLEMEACEAAKMMRMYRAASDTRSRMATRLRERLAATMLMMGQSKIATDDGRTAMVLRNSVAPLILDEHIDIDSVPVDLLERTVSNAAVRKAIRDGRNIPFARLGERGHHLRVVV